MKLVLLLIPAISLPIGITSLGAYHYFSRKHGAGSGGVPPSSPPPPNASRPQQPQHQPVEDPKPVNVSSSPSPPRRAGTSSKTPPINTVPPSDPAPRTSSASNVDTLSPANTLGPADSAGNLNASSTNNSASPVPSVRETSSNGTSSASGTVERTSSAPRSARPTSSNGTWTPRTRSASKLPSEDSVTPQTLRSSANENYGSSENEALEADMQVEEFRPALDDNIASLRELDDLELFERLRRTENDVLQVTIRLVAVRLAQLEELAPSVFTPTQKQILLARLDGNTLPFLQQLEALRNGGFWERETEQMLVELFPHDGDLLERLIEATQQ